MSTTIKPTVGRVVLVFFAAGVSMPGYALPADPLTPVPGLIAHVHNDSCINVAAFDASGGSLPITSVRLLQDSDERPTSGCWAEWMPYQRDQAKKAEDREHDAKQLAVAADREADARRLRAGVLDMALRTPGLSGHDEVMKAAAAYRAHIEGQPATSIETKTYADGTKATGPAPLPDLSPAEQDAKPVPQRGDFGFALAWLKAGKRVARAGWNGKGLFVYLVPANSYPAQTGAAKAFFGEGGMVPYNAYLALKGVDDTVSTWAPSGSDALAEDWYAIDVPGAGGTASTTA